ncbi:MAG: phytanoyl-CoA dioxygenase family protein [Caldilineaceae bacterium]|nr:phytanoyl-CoA dioxygenase family protein [Caldilineaceae bacterium]
MSYLTQAQIDQFRDEGYLLVEGLLDPVADLDPIIEEYKSVLERLAHDLYAAGTISSTYDDLPFGERVIQIYQESGKVHAQYFDFSLPQGNVKVDTPMWVGPAVFRALRNERLLDAVESLIGPEIYSNPVQHVRIKPPEHLTPKSENGMVQLGATPWHQDNGVILPAADESEILTAWFSLLDAPVESGCLQVIPRSHRAGLLAHCPRPGTGLTIPEALMETEQSVPVPTKRGDVLFLTKRTCHSSLSNVSNSIRWSFDLRYNPIGQDTGRGAFPGFIARSRLNPASELHDADAWAQLWYDARQRLAETEYNKPFNRWSADAPVCA